MSNGVHQIMAASKKTLAIAGAKRAERARRRTVRLYSADSLPLFQWSGPAKTSLAAFKLAVAKYAEALEAIFQAQGLTRADASVNLVPAESEIRTTASPNAWRVTQIASLEAEGHPHARRVRLGNNLASDIAKGVAMNDLDCIAALQSDYSLELGMWLSRAGKEGLIDIDSCWLVTSPSGVVRVPHANTVLRDVLRLFALRALSPHHWVGNINRHPFDGFRIPIYAQSKTLLALHKSRKSMASPVVLDWLQGDGLTDAARQYRESFPA